MATNTYTALYSTTLGSNTPSVTFSSIPSTYTDLVIVSNFGTTGTADNIKLNVGNGTVDTTSTYSNTRVAGDGSTASSGRNSAFAYARLNIVTGSGNGTSILNSTVINLMNYSNTSTNKTILSRVNAVNGTYNGTEAIVNLWRSNSAINIITITAESSNFLSGSTFTVYGIAQSDNSYTAKATGGTITANAGYVIHTFTSSGMFTPTENLNVDYLVVAGGGGGGAELGGGGGAGGYRTSIGNNSSISVTPQTYSITVGAGGAGGVYNSPSSTKGGNGTNSTFSTISATGGGGGAANTGSGLSGGSGGGAGRTGTPVGSGNAGGYTPVEGYAGGLGRNPYPSGGGGGAGGVGGPAVDGPNGTGVGGPGGIGASNNIAGPATYYAGGGAGATYSGFGQASGGLGGGGNGGNPINSVMPTAGTANLGGGGGGGFNQTGGNGAAGGSGVIIIRYPR